MYNYIILSYIFPQENVNKIIIATPVCHTPVIKLHFTRILSIFYQISKMKRAMYKHVPSQIRTWISIKKFMEIPWNDEIRKHVTFVSYYIHDGTISITKITIKEKHIYHDLRNHRPSFLYLPFSHDQQADPLPFASIKRAPRKSGECLIVERSP